MSEGLFRCAHRDLTVFLPPALLFYAGLPFRNPYFGIITRSAHSLGSQN